MRFKRRYSGHVPKGDGWIELDAGINGFRLFARKGESLKLVKVKVIRTERGGKANWTMEWYTNANRFTHSGESRSLMEMYPDVYDKTTSFIEDVFHNSTMEEKRSFLIGHDTKLGKDVESSGEGYIGTAPFGDGWEYIATTKSGWNVWVGEPNQWGVYDMKVVALAPQERKGNFRLKWSTNLGRLVRSDEREILEAHHKELLEEINAIMEGYADGRD